MKHLILSAGLLLFASFLSAAQVEGPAVPESGSPAPAAEFAPEVLPDFLTPAMTPAPENRATYITWSGGTCTAWLYCTGQPYWKCQSTSGNCQHTGCAITCNGITRSCPASSNCIEF